MLHVLAIVSSARRPTCTPSVVSIMPLTMQAVAVGAGVTVPACAVCVPATAVWVPTRAVCVPALGVLVPANAVRVATIEVVVPPTLTVDVGVAVAPVGQVRPPALDTVRVYGKLPAFGTNSFTVTTKVAPVGTMNEYSPPSAFGTGPISAR